MCRVLKVPQEYRCDFKEICEITIIILIFQVSDLKLTIQMVEKRQKERQVWFKMIWNRNKQINKTEEQEIISDFQTLKMRPPTLMIFRSLLKTSKDRTLSRRPTRPATRISWTFTREQISSWSRNWKESILTNNLESNLKAWTTLPTYF